MGLIKRSWKLDNVKLPINFHPNRRPAHLKISSTDTKFWANLLQHNKKHHRKERLRNLTIP